MNDLSADITVKWYMELESRLLEVIRFIQYQDNKDVFIPSLVNIILDTCGLIDSIFREEIQTKKKKAELDMIDFCNYFEPNLKLSQVKTLLYHCPLSYLIPFKNWFNHSKKKYNQLNWWSCYNKIKHDRINEFKLATLGNTMLSLSALNQIIVKMIVFFDALLRYDLMYLGKNNINYVRSELFSQNKEKVTVLIETNLFATPLGAKAFPDDIKKISPIDFSFGKKLTKYLGKDF